MVKTYNVPVSELMSKLAAELKGYAELRPPEWAEFVKTGSHKERAPLENDWWYMRAASMLRKIQILGPVGVSKLRTKYGGKKNRGVKPERFRRASGSIIRKILQQLENAELVKQVTIKNHKGRVLTPKGDSLIGKFNESKAAPAAKKAAQKVEKKKAKEPEITEEAVAETDDSKAKQKAESKKEDGGSGEDKAQKA